VTPERLAEQYEAAKGRGELLKLVRVPMGRRYLDRLGMVHTRSFKVHGDLAERLVLPEMPCPHHASSLHFPWEACPECAPGEEWDST
jgi:hypothetical protein